MENNSTTGEELIKTFFDQLAERTELDKAVIDTLCRLQAESKLTPVQISNSLEQLRKEVLNGNN